MKIFSKKDWINLAVFFVLSACLIVYIIRYTQHKAIELQTGIDSIAQIDENIEEVVLDSCLSDTIQ